MNASDEARLAAMDVEIKRLESLILDLASRASRVTPSTRASRAPDAVPTPKPPHLHIAVDTQITGSTDWLASSLDRAAPRTARIAILAARLTHTSGTSGASLVRIEARGGSWSEAVSGVVEAHDDGVASTTRIATSTALVLVATDGVFQWRAVVTGPGTPATILRISVIDYL